MKPRYKAQYGDKKLHVSLSGSYDLYGSLKSDGWLVDLFVSSPDPEKLARLKRQTGNPSSHGWDIDRVKWLVEILNDIYGIDIALNKRVDSLRRAAMRATGARQKRLHRKANRLVRQGIG